MSGGRVSSGRLTVTPLGSRPVAISQRAARSGAASASSTPSGTPLHSPEETSPCSHPLGACRGGSRHSALLLPPHSRKATRERCGRARRVARSSDSARPHPPVHGEAPARAVDAGDTVVVSLEVQAVGRDRPLELVQRRPRRAVARHRRIARDPADRRLTLSADGRGSRTRRRSRATSPVPRRTPRARRRRAARPLSRARRSGAPSPVYW